MNPAAQAGAMPSSAAMSTVLRLARRRAAASAALALAVMIGGLAWSSAAPSALGLPLALAPAFAACVALAFYGTHPPRAGTTDLGTVRTASLHVRSARTVIPPRTVALGLTLAGGYVGLVVLCGVTASRDESGRGRQIAFTAGDVAAAAGPYPGWWYGLPMLASAVALLGTAVLVAQRISATPAIPGAADQPADSAWRNASSRMVFGIALCCLCVQFGGTAFIAGESMARAALPGTAAGWTILAWTLILAGLVLVGCGVVGLLQRLARSLPSGTSRPDGTTALPAGGTAGP